MSSGSAGGSPQDEVHSGSRPNSFPCLCHMRSGTAPELMRSGLELACSRESHQDGIMRLNAVFRPT